jgi:hypothetical protein
MTTPRRVANQCLYSPTPTCALPTKSTTKECACDSALQDLASQLVNVTTQVQQLQYSINSTLIPSYFAFVKESLYFS